MSLSDTRKVRGGEYSERTGKMEMLQDGAGDICSNNIDILDRRKKAEVTKGYLIKFP